jgi:hypothetical protein
LIQKGRVVVYVFRGQAGVLGDGVHILYCGNGRPGFRFYSGSLSKSLGFVDRVHIHFFGNGAITKPKKTVLPHPGEAPFFLSKQHHQTSRCLSSRRHEGDQ